MRGHVRASPAHAPQSEPQRSPTPSRLRRSPRVDNTAYDINYNNVGDLAGGGAAVGPGARGGAAADGDAGRRDGFAPRDRAPARGLHHGVLRLRPRPAHRPRLPRRHHALPPRHLPPRLPAAPLQAPRRRRGRLARRLPRDLPRQQVVPGVRGDGHDGGAVPAAGARAGRVRAGRRRRGAGGDAAPVPAVLPDPDGERGGLPQRLLAAGAGAGAAALHGAPGVRHPRLGVRRVGQQDAHQGVHHAGGRLALVRPLPRRRQPALLLRQPLRLPHPQVPPPRVREVLPHARRGLRQDRRGQACARPHGGAGAGAARWSRQAGGVQEGGLGRLLWHVCLGQHSIGAISALY